MKKYIYIGILTTAVMGTSSSAGGLEYSDDGKTCKLVGSLTPKIRQEILSSDFSRVRTLDLSGHREVDDNFLEELSKSPSSARLYTLSLQGTSVTEEGLRHLYLSENLGTLRDMRQMSDRYNAPATEVYLDVRDTSVRDIDTFQRPVGDVKLRYQRLADGAKTDNDATGIRSLRFMGGDK